MTFLCERCGAENPKPYGSTPYGSDTMLCPSCAKRAGVGQGDEHPALAALRHARGLAEGMCICDRVKGDHPQCYPCELDAAIPQLEALLAERAEMVGALAGVVQDIGEIEERMSAEPHWWDDTVTAGTHNIDRARALLAKLPGGSDG